MPPLLSIDHHNGVPAYRQIMDQVKLQAATWVLAPGTEMPSTRALSADLAINPMTVSKAYGLLERDGVLERRRGQTLTVRAPDKAPSGEDARLVPLRTHLHAAALLSRQLDITPKEALRLLREELEKLESP